MTTQMTAVPTRLGENSRSLEEARTVAAGVLNAYSSILFVDHALIGLAFLIATFWFPNVGIAGLLGAVIGMLVGYGLRLPYATSGVNVYSSLLVGLSLGAYYRVDLNLGILIVLSAALTVLMAAALRDVLWRLGRLPVLSVPFVIVALTVALAASSYGGLSLYMPPSALPPGWIGGWVDSFLSSLGSVYFSPHPMVGAVLFVGIFLRSPFLAFLCLTGFASGEFVFTTLAVDPAPGLLAWTGFNFALTAMAVGGIYSVPGIGSFSLAMLAAASAAIVTAALSRLFLVYGLPVMAAPFLLTTLTILAALRLRQSTAAPILLLEQPGLPETNFERARLARTRLGSLDSVPLLAPFLGEWNVYQGFDGSHTHQDRWRFALDFHRVENGRSYNGRGAGLEDFYCFGLPVLSPGFGIVTESRDDLADNLPGDMDLTNNWGNYVIMQADSGVYLLLAHLRQNSVKVKRGERVTPETVIAACGNSGRSPQPHLHLQVQRHGSLGGATIPFHLVSAVTQSAGAERKFQLVARPSEGESVRRAEEDTMLATPLRLPAGRTLTYRLQLPGGESAEHTLTVEVTLLGQTRLRAENGASVAFEHLNATLAFYDRQGPADALLDAFCLAIGLTPLSRHAVSWVDAPPARLLSLNALQRSVLRCMRPLGAGLKSRYQRRQSPDRDRCWLQSGTHVLEAGRLKGAATTTALLCPESGIRLLEMRANDQHWRAELTTIGQRQDWGIPGWKHDIPAVQHVSAGRTGEL